MNADLNASQVWDKIKTYAKKVGRAGTMPVLLLYYVMTDEATPRSVKLTVGSALAYLILPIKHITPEIERKTDEVLDKWFAEYTRFEEIE